MGGRYTESSSQSILKNRLGIVFFIVPFLFSALQLQAFGTLYVSETLADILGYLMLALLLAGMIFYFNDENALKFTSIIKWWIVFYLSYYLFSTIASLHLNRDYLFLKTIIPVLYFFGFAFYLGNKEHRKLFVRIMTWTFFLSCIATIYLDKINFSLEFSGVYKYRVERAGGLFGDANNSALVSILSFSLIYYKYAPKLRLWKIFKAIALLISVYSIVITYSTTGYLAFFVVLMFVLTRYFSGIKIFLFVLFFSAMIPLGLEFVRTGDTFSEAQKNKIENFVNLLTLNSEEVDFSDRDRRFIKLMNDIEKHPIMGNGLSYGKDTIESHNTIFNIWVDAGVITFIVFLMVIGMYFFKILMNNPDDRYLFLSIMIAFFLFMLSLQSVINQPYLMTVFVYLAYCIEKDSLIEEHSNQLS